MNESKQTENTSDVDNNVVCKIEEDQKILDDSSTEGNVGVVKSEKLNDNHENVQSEEANTAQNDPYAYLHRNGFTSELFKIEVRSLPRYYGIKELKKLLNEKLNLNATKIKVPTRRGTWIYVCFKSEEERATAVEKLKNYCWKGAYLKVEKAKPSPDPLVKKRLQESNENGPTNKKLKLNEDDILERIKDATAPLWRLPYDEQLKQKTEHIKVVLNSYESQLKGANPALSMWCKEQKAKYDGLICELCPIRYAEEILGYRNKCEFSIGLHETTGEKTIGFRMGSYVSGTVSVGPIYDIPFICERMKVVVHAFEKFVRCSELDVYNPEVRKGYWQQVTVRYGFRTDQLMFVIGMNPQKLKAPDLANVKQKIKEYFTEGEGKSCSVTSLYLELLKKKKSQKHGPVLEHIFGETHITEKILGRTFRISPHAFFQINTRGTEIMYETIAELAGLTEDVTLLDVCCGTGSIGISLADKCGEVLGLEISPEAIADAHVNVANNNVTNAQFFAGKAEDILSAVAYKSTKKDIIAIVDPPRAGLHNSALVQLRKNERINKLVYVACDARRATKNFVDFGRAMSKMYKGGAFLPVKAIPVDLFPYTNHLELLIYFERSPEF